MKKISNLKMKSLTFTLNDGSTLRLFPTNYRILEEDLIPTGLYIAERKGIIRIEDEVVYPAGEKVEVAEELPKILEVEESLPSFQEKSITTQKSRKKPSRRLDHNE